MFSIVISLFFCFNGHSQCPSNSITFSTQAELDAFPNDYPNCVGMGAYVNIDSAVTNLQGLNQLTSIGGLRILETTALENLSGLENLTSVGKFYIKNNTALKNFNGLGGLTIVEEDFEVRENPALENFEGLESLTTIEDRIDIVGNDTLESIAGLENLTDVGGNVLILDNKFLKSLNGFDNLTFIRSLTISNNISLLNVEGLNNLTSISFELYLSGNDAMENLNGLESLDSIMWSLKILGNDSLVNFEGLSSLQFIGNHFNIDGNNSLQNFEGLSGLTELVGSFNVKNNSMLQSFEGLSLSLKYINYLLLDSNNSMNDLTGFEHVDTLRGTRIKNNDLLINLNGLEQLTHFGSVCEISGNNSLTSLEGLNNIEYISGNFYIENNSNLTNLLSLENLQNIYGILEIENNSGLENLLGLEPLSYNEGLKIVSNDNLINLFGLENLEEINGTFTVKGNSSFLSMAGVSNLKEVNGSFVIEDCDSLVNLDGLENLETMGGVDGDIFRIVYNENISDFSSLLDVDISNIMTLHIYDNSQLSVCDLPNICNYLGNAGGHYIANNLNGCNNSNQILSECAESQAKIQLNIFYDSNQNKIKDSLEQYMPLASVTILPTNQIFYSNQDFGGYAFLDEGNYEMVLNQSLLPDWSLVTDSSSYHINIGSIITCDTISFGLYPLEENSNTIAYITGPPARCGEFKTFEVHAKNLGTTITNGTIWLEIDELIDSAPLVDVSDTVVAPNLYGWHFENLYPGYTFDAAISLEIPIPPFVMIGDSLRFNSYVEYEDVNGTAVSDNFYYPTEIRCSFDPNDKLVNPSRNNNLTLFEEDLIYAIRFQNTGNDEAYDIIIRDTLDGNLDPTTFRVLSTSHPNSLITSMEADQYLTFNFENIYLPDSTTNFDESQGYVSYLISPIDGLDEETIIENTASIYFDFNPPIVTNTTESVMVSELPTSIHNLGGEEGMKIEIFPNPVSDNIFIKKETSETLVYQITDVNGRLLLIGELIDEIHNITFTKINSGVCFIKIINPVTREFFVEKIVK